MSNVKNIWHMILGMPKTIYFNLVCFGIDGLIFPCILSDRVKLISLRGGGEKYKGIFILCFEDLVGVLFVVFGLIE